MTVPHLAHTWPRLMAVPHLAHTWPRLMAVPHLAHTWPWTLTTATAAPPSPPPALQVPEDQPELKRARLAPSDMDLLLEAEEEFLAKLPGRWGWWGGPARHHCCWIKAGEEQGSVAVMFGTML